MNKKLWSVTIGILLVIIGITPIFISKTFHIGLELVWFSLGLLWILSSLKLNKTTKYRPFDHLIYLFATIYGLTILYLILLKPGKWNQTFTLFEFKITESLLISIISATSLFALVNHFIYQKLKPKEKRPKRRKK